MQKPKNFLAFFSRLLPPPLRREAEKEMERKFLVLLRRFSLRKEQSYFNIFVCSFLHPHGDRGALVSAFGGDSKLCGFDDRSANSLKWSLAMQNFLRNGEAQILHVFAPPSRAHTSSPPFLGEIIKRRGWLPLTQEKHTGRHQNCCNKFVPQFSAFIEKDNSKQDRQNNR